MNTEFKLMRFNPRRAARKAAAAEVLVSYDGQEEDDLLWMNERDLKLNIHEFGPHAELLKAQEHYRSREEFPV